MAQDDDPPEPVEEMAPADQTARVRRRAWPAVLLLLGGLLLVALVGLWLARERIANGVIAGQLEALDLPATYHIESIGPRRQILRDVVIGDPRRPDMTIERLEAVIEPRLGVPVIGAVNLVRPRLYGRYRQGKLSFGSLDRVLFTGKSNQLFRLPELDLTIVDGRGLVDSEFGPVGIKLEGMGNLRGGFAGVLAAVAPRARALGCTADRLSLYGRVRVTGEKPRFTGPLRLAGVACTSQAMRLDNAGLKLDVTADSALAGFEGQAGLDAARLDLGDSSWSCASSRTRFTYRGGALTARYELAARDVAAAQAGAARLELTGVLWTADGLARIETEGALSGAGLRLGSGLETTLAGLERSAAGTLGAPLIGRLRSGIRRESAGSRLNAAYILRRNGQVTNLVVPQAALLGGSGTTLLSVSRLQFTAEGTGVPRLAGNFSTGGDYLPRIAGRMERGARGELIMRTTMAEYGVGDARLALPRLALVQLPGGRLGFSGEALVSGPLPGGRADNLLLPLAGNWSRAGGLLVGRTCTVLRFDRLTLASLAIERRAVTLCPPRGGAIVRADSGGVRLAAGIAALDLAGRQGATPVRIRSGPVGFAMPGTLAARSLDVELGPQQTASRFRIANLDARIGRQVEGSFAGSDVRLNAVPLDVLDAAGRWRYTDGRLTLSDGSFRLEDRQVDDRFQPMIARGGTLSLASNQIVAEATLREPASDREIVHAAIRHDLASGRGQADLAVEGLLFDQKLQPEAVTRLALGVIANTRGTLRGAGQIAWTERGVTSTGRFTTDSFDFAAAFGPVKGVAGTIVFTDLLGMVTAPGQQLRIASVNPGIEVNDGLLTYALRPGMVLAVEGATWPFMDGTLTLRPVTMKFGIAEVRRYVLAIDGLNAARFVERLELANISATGTFDGALPLVFDENGGRIEGGLLRSRPPGGNVSYVGALTYKDLSTMANFAFDALKSLDYREMSVGMDGALAGELVTRVRFYGVKQGATAKRNFLTDRVAKLPIEFNVNLRAPFLQLVSSFRSLYDPSYIRDPRGLGLIDAQGRPLPKYSPLPPQPAGIQP